MSYSIHREDGCVNWICVTVSRFMHEAGCQRKIRYRHGNVYKFSCCYGTLCC